MPKKSASELRKDDIVSVMGIEYVVQDVEATESDVDIWLQPVEAISTHCKFITINATPGTPVETLKTSSLGKCSFCEEAYPVGKPMYEHTTTKHKPEIRKMGAKLSPTPFA